MAKRDICKYCKRGILDEDTDLVDLGEGEFTHKICVENEIKGIDKTLKYLEAMYDTREISRDVYIEKVKAFLGDKEKLIKILKGEKEIQKSTPKGNCSFPECTNIDFLLTTCKRCGQKFCWEHHLPENHNCSLVEIIRQPKTAREIELEKALEREREYRERLELEREYEDLIRAPQKSAKRAEKTPRIEESIESEKSWYKYAIYIIVFFLVVAVADYYSLSFDKSTPTAGEITKEVEKYVPSLSTPPTTPTKTIESVPVSDLEKRIFTKINQIRTENKISTLSWNERVAEVARAYSIKMYKEGFFSHDTPNREDVIDRLKQANIFFITAAENLYYAEGYEPTRLQEIVVDGWMKSPGHRSSILDYSNLYNEAGVGVYCKDKTCYVTMIFVDRHLKDSIELKPQHTTFIPLYRSAYPFDFDLEVRIRISSPDYFNAYLVPSEDEWNKFLKRYAYASLREWQNKKVVDEVIDVSKGFGIILESSQQKMIKIDYEILYITELSYKKTYNYIVNKSVIIITK